MKNLRTDDEGLIPIIIGVAIAGLLGYSWLTDTTDQTWEVIKVLAVACLLFIFGLVSLMGKLALPKFMGVILGFGCIGFAVYIVYLGSFPW